MVQASDGTALHKSLVSGDEVSLQFSTVDSIGTDFAISSEGLLAESWGGSGLGAGLVDGNPGDKSAKLYPDMSFLLWAAQSLEYQARLAERTAGRHVAVPIFESTHLRPATGDCYGAAPFGCGPWKSIPQKTLRLSHSPTVHLDMALSCGGAQDKDCPQWDHIITLRACCTSAQGGDCPAQSGFELGRWMTSFGRREGHWLSDISPLGGLLQAHQTGQCNFTVFSAPWAGNQGSIPWVVTLALRVGLNPSAAAAVNPPAALSSVTQPTVLTPWLGTTTETGGIAEVFRWVFFNQSFSSHFPPFEFSRSPAVTKVVLAAYITGHGNDQHGCGEFCATTHHFGLNGHSFVKNNSVPATNPQLGCTHYVATGVVPNEYGTWLYGRDGWCNGHPVSLWQMDVTAASTVGSNILTYSGLWNGTLPDPGPPAAWQQAEPVIMASMYLMMM